MEPKQALELGKFIRNKRVELGYSTRELSAICGVNDATIVRIENGAFAAPRPDKLSKISKGLGIKLSDVFALAEYVTPLDLPSFNLYMRSKYTKLPKEAVSEIERYVNRLAKKHGIIIAGPDAGEDEDEINLVKVNSKNLSTKGGGNEINKRGTKK